MTMQLPGSWSELPILGKNKDRDSGSSTEGRKSMFLRTDDGKSNTVSAQPSLASGNEGSGTFGHRRQRADSLRSGGCSLKVPSQRQSLESFKRAGTSLSFASESVDNRPPALRIHDRQLWEKVCSFGDELDIVRTDQGDLLTGLNSLRDEVVGKIESLGASFRFDDLRQQRLTEAVEAMVSMQQSQQAVAPMWDDQLV